MALTIDPASIDSEKRQFKVVIATETPVFRRGWEENFFEVLVCDKNNMRTQRMDNGVCPFLNNHDIYSGLDSQLGSLISYEVSDGEIRGTIQFSKNPNNDGYWADIEAGIVRGISARYIPWVYERQIIEGRVEPNYRAIDWEITEISAAPVPADYNSMVRSATEGIAGEVVIRKFLNQTSNMLETQTPGAPESAAPAQPAAAPTAPAATEQQVRAQATADERQRVIAIRGEVRKAKLPEEFADQLVNEGVTIDVARAQIIDKRAEADTTPTPRTQSQQANASGDEKDLIRAAMSDALISRAEPGSIKLEGKAQEYRGMSMLDMARHMLQLNGESNPFRFGINETVKRAIATTDYPDLLTSTTSRTLRKYYEMYNSGLWKKLATQTSVSDFRAKTGVKVDGAVTFEKIAEGGDYKASKLLQNANATIAVETFGRLIKITRHAIINDDLDVFGRIPKMIAQGASMMQAKAVWDMLTGNAKTPDGKTLFHADHKNLAAQGAALSEATLNAAIVAMAKQKSPAGHLLNIQPKYLLVPVELQTAAKKILSSLVVPGTTADVNVFAGAFEPISDVFLSEASATAWYLAADPNMIEGLLYAYLDGEEGVYTETRTNFDDDSVETKARLEFGVAAWGYEGFYKNPGA